MQTFAVIVKPTEAEINKTWTAQVFEPFQQTLATKFPFAAGVAASRPAPTKSARCSGPTARSPNSSTPSIGPLVVRRGDVLAPRTWADMGISWRRRRWPSFPGWIAPLGAERRGHAPQRAADACSSSSCRRWSPGATEFTIEIDGQQLRYRNTPPPWTNMVHGRIRRACRARASRAVTPDGRTVELLNEPGQFGLKRMIEAASAQAQGRRRVRTALEQRRRDRRGRPEDHQQRRPPAGAAPRSAGQGFQRPARCPTRSSGASRPRRPVAAAGWRERAQ